MAGNVIDLRQSPPPPAPQADPTIPSQKPSLASLEKSAPAAALLRWSSQEDAPRERSGTWYAVVTLAAIILAVSGILLESYFFVTFVVLAFAVTLLSIRRESRPVMVEITTEGVRVGKRFHPFAALKSFWIRERSGTRELSLETNHFLIPFLTLPLGEMESETVRRLLQPHLVEKEHRESVSEQVMRNLGF